MSGKTMKAVVFNGKLDVSVEDRPIPEIQDPTDIIVKVRYSALCGSELHVFRGHQPSSTGFIMGHESTGTIVELGSSVKTHKVGDIVVMPFTTSCGTCFYCSRGFSSRCASSLLFGSPLLDGGQAEYLRVPNADATAVQAPSDVDEKLLVLMADIFPTGYFAADNAFRGFDRETVEQSVVLLVGCGPVGLCALINALEFKPKVILAVDRVPDRLKLAVELGEGRVEAFEEGRQMQELRDRVKVLTEGRGVDTVIEGVGHADALKLGFELLRPWGNISSFGVHNEDIPFTGNQAYNKNLRIQMGRCPVRSIFLPALEVLKKNQHKLGFMTQKILPMSQVVQGYDEFNRMLHQKVIFEPGNKA